MKPVQYLLIVLGWICILLGAIGIFVPLLPTTPFMILAALLFSKGSPRLHAWLLSRPKFGKAISDWEKKGIIRLRAKWIATISIVLCFSATLIFVEVGTAIKAIILLIGLSVLIFIWTRPDKVDV